MRAHRRPAAQSLDEIEAILAKAERSMNELKGKIAAETQSIR
jgi:hypothetical protein